MAYYSVNEDKKLPKKRVHRTDQNCRSGRRYERMSGGRERADTGTARIVRGRTAPKPPVTLQTVQNQ